MTSAAPQPIPTRQGTAAVRVHEGSRQARGTLLVGHGAGGTRDAADVLALTALTEDGWTVVLVDQPWRVAGRKVATRPATLDEAWLDVVETLGESDAAPDGTPLPRPWVYAGRSAGARVACRTSVLPAVPAGSSEAPGTTVREVRPGVSGVLCLAFPLHPPGRPDRPRTAELAGPVGAGVPTLVVQGATDPMGRPEEIADAVTGPSLVLRTVPGGHGATKDLDAVLSHVREHLAGLA